jgi:hypothetical protein
VRHARVYLQDTEKQVGCDSVDSIVDGHVCMGVEIAHGDTLETVDFEHVVATLIGGK